MNRPRVMIAAVKSGSGKTTITCALLKALAKRGENPCAFKCGPDFIDPMFHEKVLGIPSVNLDSFFMEEESLQAYFLSECEEQNIAVVEGVMGLYDGLGGIREEGSSYDVAKKLNIPIILVVDAHGMGRSILPLLSGFLHYDTQKLIKGVILNRTGKMFLSTIAPEIEALGIEVMGAYPKQEDLTLKSRHLGLLLPGEVEKLDEKITQASEVLEQNIQVERLIHLARSAPVFTRKTEIKVQENRSGAPIIQTTGRVPIAVAMDEAFCFYYKANLKLMEELGATLIPFSPIHDKQLPESAGGFLLGGGYPEVYAAQLAANEEMKQSIRKAYASGIPSLAECGGFLYLHEKLITEDQEAHAMAGLLKAEAYYTGKPVRFGYVSIKEKSPLFLNEKEEIRGHEFHYFESTQSGTDCTATKPVTGRQWDCVWEDEQRFWGFPHLYYRSNPAFIKKFIAQCRKINEKKGAAK